MNSRWRHLRVLRTLYVLASLILAGCATLQTTPQQDYTYEVGRNCETPTTKLERVAPDGRYWIQARGDAGIASTEYPRFFACMKDQFQAYPYFDWLKAQKRDATQPPAAVGSIDQGSKGRDMSWGYTMDSSSVKDLRSVAYTPSRAMCDVERAKDSYNLPRQNAWIGATLGDCQPLI